MKEFGTKRPPGVRDAIAPDGPDVRILLKLSSGSVAHFELGPGETSIPVANKTVEEVWYVLSGRGEMWRKLCNHEEVVDVEPEVCITIPAGTHFQSRSFEGEPLAAVGVTMPPWPGEGESYDVKGKKEWKATITRES
jgi:mannose-6-phosphate isomerase-like protein (cupin superfamily)